MPLIFFRHEIKSIKRKLMEKSYLLILTFFYHTTLITRENCSQFSLTQSFAPHHTLSPIFSPPTQMLSSLLCTLDLGLPLLNNISFEFFIFFIKTVLKASLVFLPFTFYFLLFTFLSKFSIFSLYFLPNPKQESN